MKIFLVNVFVATTESGGKTLSLYEVCFPAKSGTANNHRNWSSDLSNYSPFSRDTHPFSVSRKTSL